ncbi:right-handed parallel beta-helix repeat-containing protein [Methanococcoides sp. FTZ1]|uniref:right-handed parallel beta-helix repeat-containing protein n=1 Tax=Methanococcoides sp. FTZ1 TaxID=3439061 RepID=UPI003F84F39F
MRIKKTILICFGIALVLMTVGTASAGTITVNNSTGPVADFTSIQAAIDAAVDGDTVLVYPGTYNENVDVYKELTIISQSGNPDDTHVRAASSNDYVFTVIANNVTISGFNVTGASELPKAGIHLEGDDENSTNNNTISNNKISNNWCGISLRYSSNNKLINNTVNSNNGGGIWLTDFSNENTLINNTANSNNNHGIMIGLAFHNELTNNTANGNSGIGILLSVESGNNKLISNTANGNSGGIFLSGSCCHNDLINNTANWNNGDGISLTDWCSYNKLTNNIVNSNDQNGIYLQGYSEFNTLDNNSISSNEQNGIYISFSCSNTLTSNIVNSNNWTGIELFSICSDNIIYNNYFDNTNNTLISADSTGNIWNITKTAGTNIIGGPYLGGNYWSHPDGTGFSQMNEDTDSDGFCDSPLSEYELDVNNIDYLPLYLAPLTPTEKVENLRDYISSLEGVDNGTKESLNAKLDNAIHHLEKGDEDKAIKKLEDLIKFVSIMERQDKLGDEQAEYLINEANSIIEMIQNSEG